ncbi:MAG: hypothetical protein WBR30_22405, partial [Candidatus Sulfotelmatobacter sp.]
MRSSWFFGAVLFSCLALIPALAESPAAAKLQTSVEQTATGNEKSLIEAKKKDDGAYFKRTLSQDFSLVGVDGKLLEGQEAV